MVKTIFCAVILLINCWAGETSATMISFLGDNGTEQLGSLSGYLSYNPVNSNTADLTISLLNTSPAANGGYLTAFAFNNPGNAITGVRLDHSPATAGFQILGASSGGKHAPPSFQDTISAPPFGRFDLGAATGNSFLGNGGSSGNRGLAPGQSVTFNFAFTGNHLDDLTVLSFVTALSDQSKDPQFLVARFRSFNNGASDKVPGIATGPVTSTPIPSTLILLGSALACLEAIRRCKRP